MPSKISWSQKDKYYMILLIGSIYHSPVHRIESRMVVAGALSKHMKFQLSKISYRYLLYNTVPIANNTELYT